MFFLPPVLLDVGIAASLINCLIYHGSLLLTLSKVKALLHRMKHLEVHLLLTHHHKMPWFSSQGCLSSWQMRELMLLSVFLRVLWALLWCLFKRKQFDTVVYKHSFIEEFLTAHRVAFGQCHGFCCGYQAMLWLWWDVMWLIHAIFWLFLFWQHAEMFHAICYSSNKCCLLATAVVWFKEIHI